jgi:predicted site-specific integrase-resolvase
MTLEHHVGASQAAVICGVSTKTIQRWAEAGKLHPVKTALGALYPREEVERLAEERGSLVAA